MTRGRRADLLGGFFGSFWPPLALAGYEDPVLAEEQNKDGRVVP